ncbi:MAG: GNAT family N-acetyltransferase [Clostridia bacterium]|nr:GNAT family N-acetyltransferase [Clostridia bacterium]
MPILDESMTFLETERLRLRPFSEADYPLICRISADPGTTEFLYFWGRIGATPETDTQRYLDYALSCWRETPVRAREYCVILKDTGEAIGQGSVEWVADDPGTAELGWILLPENRGRGYATEMGRELMRAAFEMMGARKVIAHCDDRNAPSYQLMERLGMRLTDIEQGARPAKRPGDCNGDERTYALSRDGWDIQRAWAEYHTYACHFDDFALLPPLTDGRVSLRTERLCPADPVKRYVPAYHFEIMANDQPVGKISLRIGYPDSLLYGGQIGYNVDEPYRGHGYAGAACRLLFPVMRAHGMRSAIITNNVENTASRRVCEKNGARFLCQIDIPEDHEMYKNGSRRVNVYALDAE